MPRRSSIFSKSGAASNEERHRVHRTQNGSARRSSFEAVCAARAVADKLGGTRARGDRRRATPPRSPNNSRPIRSNDPHLGDRRAADGWLDPPSMRSRALRAAAGPSLVILVGNTMIGRDVGSRFAARLDAGSPADVTEITVAGETCRAFRPSSAVSTITTCAFKSDYGVAAIRPNVFAAARPPARAKWSPSRPAAKLTLVTLEGEVDEAAAELGRRGSVGRRRAAVAGWAVPSRSRRSSRISPMPSAERSARRAPRSTPAGSRTATKSARPVKPSARHSTSRSASRVRSSTKSGCARRKPSSPSTRTAPCRSRDFADLLVVGDAFEIVPELAKLVRDAKAVHA